MVLGEPHPDAVDGRAVPLQQQLIGGRKDVFPGDSRRAAARRAFFERGARLVIAAACLERRAGEAWFGFQGTLDALASRGHFP